MSEYPECDKLAEASKLTQPIGEFLDWLNSQGIELMTYREDLSDERLTDTECRERRRVNRNEPCWPKVESEPLLAASANYYDTHCLHWHGRGREHGDDLGAEQGKCCWCEKGRTYTITTRGWTRDPRGYEQLLADWAGVDLKKVDAERRQMLEALRAANGSA